METKARDIIRHNHITRDIKDLGKCPDCDQYHYNQLQKRVEELESALQGARAHAEVMEHKATRVNAMLRDREAENKKLREALKQVDAIIKIYIGRLPRGWGYSNEEILLKDAVNIALGEVGE